MKNLKNMLFIAITLMASYNAISIASDDIMMDEFVVVEHNPEAIEVDNSKSTSQKVTDSIENAKKMITKAESNLNKVKNAVESEEVSKFVSTLKKMKSAL